MFWVVILIVVLLTIGASVLIGRAISARDSDGRRLTNREKVNMAKVAGAFPHRKESQD